MAITMKDVHDALRRLNMRLPGFTIDGAYGGWQLERVINRSDGTLGVRTFGGHEEKRKVLARINAMCDGVDEARIKEGGE